MSIWRLETAPLIGWRYALFYALHLDRIRDWLLRTIYCHHNARVLADMDSLAAMRAEIEQYISDRCEEAVSEALIEHGITELREGGGQ